MATNSSFIRAIDDQAQKTPDATLFFNSNGESMTYGEFFSCSNALACWLSNESHIEPKVPIVVYGHKSPYMFCCMMACVKAGHAYVPIDTVFPKPRIAAIVEQVEAKAGPTLLLNTTTTTLDELPCEQLALNNLVHASERQVSSQEIDSLRGVQKDDTFYILFTSGSTGEPKGVQILTECVDEFSKWMLDAYTFGDEPRIWFNRTPYSFDVSITDMVCGTVRGDTTFALEKEAETSIPSMFDALASCNATDWVSTPSSVEQCLADASFDHNLMPHLKRMLLAGETLRPSTVREVKRRFPGIRVFNGYGPTESTNLVTLCEITDELLQNDLALPIGYPKTDSDLVVLDPDTLEQVPTGTSGELFIIGKTVGNGYWGCPELTQAAFHSCPEEITCGRRSYRTGDEVHYGDDGRIYFHGRLDLQIKLHGYRIELGDIESQLCALEKVHMACVLPVWRDGSIHHLMACVVPTDRVDKRGMELTRLLKAQLHQNLPSYMVPRVFKYLDTLPLNTNGKADRKALSAQFKTQ